MKILEIIDKEVKEDISPTAKRALQKTVDYAKKKGYQLKYSPKRQSISFINKEIDHRIDARVFNDGWVHFVDHELGIDGNDPAEEFLGTFINYDQRARQEYEERMASERAQQADDEYYRDHPEALEMESKWVNEMASAGATGAGAVATVATPLMKEPVSRKGSAPKKKKKKLQIGKGVYEGLAMSLKTDLKQVNTSPTSESKAGKMPQKFVIIKLTPKQVKDLMYAAPGALNDADTVTKIIDLIVRQASSQIKLR